MAKDKEEGKDAKPSSEIKDAAKIQDNAVKAREWLRLIVAKSNFQSQQLIQKKLRKKLKEVKSKSKKCEK